MNKTRYLRLTFDKPLMAYEIAYFRSAIVEATQRRSDLFHNHKGDDGFVYRYPLIQYKIIDKKPAIVCLNAGTDDIHYLLQNRGFQFRIKDKVIDFEIDEMVLRYHHFQTWSQPFRYNVHNYIPFNQENYSVYQKLGSEKRKLAFLEELLNKHLTIITEGLDCSLPHDLFAEIETIKSEKYIEYKGVFHLTFCLNIRTNLSLVNYMGIGKGSSLGFGIVKKLSNSSRDENRNGQRKRQGRPGSITA